MAQKKTEAKQSHSKTQELRSKAANRVKAVRSEGAQKVGSHVGGFFDFIRTQNVIGLAVGLAVGTAAGDTVKKIVEGFINPIVQLIVGSQEKLGTATWQLELFGRTADFAWGAALSSAITLIATALVIYWIVSLFKLDLPAKK